MKRTISLIRKHRNPVLSVSLFTVAILVGLAAIAVPDYYTTKMLAGDYEGNAACQSCIESAYAEWQRCIADEAGGDVGDADCADKRDLLIGHCQTGACITSAERQPYRGTADLLMEAMSPTVAAQTTEPTKCDYAWDACTNMERADFESCLIVGSSTFDQCVEHSSSIYRGCMRSWGCSINYLPTHFPVGN